MLFGALCGTGWLIAYSNLVQPGAWSSMLNIFPIFGFGRLDGYIIIIFYAISIIGLVISLQALKEEI